MGQAHWLWQPPCSLGSGGCSIQVEHMLGGQGEKEQGTLGGESDPRAKVEPCQPLMAKPTRMMEMGQAGPGGPRSSWSCSLRHSAGGPAVCPHLPSKKQLLGLSQSYRHAPTHFTKLPLPPTHHHHHHHRRILGVAGVRGTCRHRAGQ